MMPPNSCVFVSRIGNVRGDADDSPTVSRLNSRCDRYEIVIQITPFVSLPGLQ